MKFPIERRMGPETNSTGLNASIELTDYAQKLEERIKKVHETHRIKLREEQEAMKERYDKEIKITHKYHAGDRVYLKDATGIVGVSRKLQPEYYKDVFEIIKVESDHNVRLRNTVTNKDLQLVTHVDRIKPVVQRNTIKEIPEEETTQESITETEEEANNKGDILDEKTENGNSETEEDNMYRIVQQKGSGNNRRFRIQWKETGGKTRSCWTTLENVAAETLEKWEQTHGKTGHTLKTFQRPRKQLKAE
jgi:hypothetical protein